jgi:hypothetical protein
LVVNRISVPALVLVLVWPLSAEARLGRPARRRLGERDESAGAGRKERSNDDRGRAVGSHGKRPWPDVGAPGSGKPMELRALRP